MFEQDRLQGRINQLFERIESQLRQVLKEKKYVTVKALSMMNPYWQRNYLLFVKGCYRVLSVQNFAIAQR